MEKFHVTILSNHVDGWFIWRHSDPFNIKIEAIESSLISAGTQKCWVPVLLRAIDHLKSGCNRLAVEMLSQPQASGIAASYFYQIRTIGNARLGRVAEARNSWLQLILLGGEDFGYNEFQLIEVDHVSNCNQPCELS